MVNMLCYFLIKIGRGVYLFSQFMAFLYDTLIFIFLFSYMYYFIIITD